MPHREANTKPEITDLEMEKTKRVHLEKRIHELENELAQAQAHAFTWARLHSVSNVTIESIRKMIPVDIINHGVLFEDLCLRIGATIKNQPDQLTAARYIVGAVVATMSDKFERRMKSGNAPSTPTEFLKWMSAQSGSWT